MDTNTLDTLSKVGGWFVHVSANLKREFAGCKNGPRLEYLAAHADYFCGLLSQLATFVGVLSALYEHHCRTENVARGAAVGGLRTLALDCTAYEKRMSLAIRRNVPGYRDLMMGKMSYESYLYLQIGDNRELLRLDGLQDLCDGFAYWRQFILNQEIDRERPATRFS